MVDYIYLHGFASGPQSYKGRWLQSHYQDLGIKLRLPDLNQDDFEHLTLTRQIAQITDQLTGPTTLIGSSLGGLVAAWVAEGSDYVERLVFLAPAFQFLEQWLPRLGESQMNHWQSSGWLSVYHYGLKSQRSLHYDFVIDAQRYADNQLSKAIPTLILHGTHDQVIAFDASQNYAKQRSWVTLQSLNTDHAMADAMVEIAQAVTGFCL